MYRDRKVVTIRPEIAESIIGIIFGIALIILMPMDYILAILILILFIVSLKSYTKKIEISLKETRGVIYIRCYGISNDSISSSSISHPEDGVYYFILENLTYQISVDNKQISLQDVELKVTFIIPLLQRQRLVHKLEELGIKEKKELN